MIRGTLLALGAVLVLGAAPADVDAQRPGRDGPPRAGVRAERGQRAPGPGIEGILRQREALELTEQQFEALDGLRTEQLQERTRVREEMARIRSEMAAGAMEIEEGREALHALRDEQHALGDRMRGSVDEILTEAQRETLRENRREAMRGRRDGLRRGGGDRSGTDRPARRFRRPGG